MPAEEIGSWIDHRPRFFELMGQSMATWAEIEYQLCTLFCFCVGDKNGSGTAAFYSIAMFRTKLMTIDAAAEKALNRPDKPNGNYAAWRSLNNRLMRLSKTRNKIAHYCARPRIIENDTEPSEYRVELIQPRVGLGSDKSPEEISGNAITLEKLESKLEAFKKVHQDLAAFNQSLGLKPDLIGLLTRSAKLGVSTV